MLQPLLPLLALHIVCALASPILFSMRAWRSIRGRNPAQGWLRVTPHVVDTLLLFAGIGLAFLIRQYPFVNGWLTAKLLGLIAYVGVGHVAVRRAHSARGKMGAWLLGLVIVLYIYAVAVSKNPLPGLGVY
ncbi:MAG TPA: SirB2 family protein [Steroidobacteraceae bacterium]|nr:SirB2 family protein [Steroidobacteraceae bacterium]